MKIFRLIAWAFATLLAAPAFAGTETATDGSVSITLTKQLYCGTVGLLQGNIGLIIGLIFVATAVWGLINGGKWKPALILMVSGALITALPSLINSFFTGYGAMLQNAKIGTVGFTSMTQECINIAEKPTVDKINKSAQDNLKQYNDSGILPY